MKIKPLKENKIDINCSMIARFKGQTHRYNSDRHPTNVEIRNLQFAIKNDKLVFVRE